MAMGPLMLTVNVAGAPVAAPVDATATAASWGGYGGEWFLQNANTFYST